MVILQSEAFYNFSFFGITVEHSSKLKILQKSQLIWQQHNLEFQFSTRFLSLCLLFCFISLNKFTQLTQSTNRPVSVRVCGEAQLRKRTGKQASERETF